VITPCLLLGWAGLTLQANAVWYDDASLAAAAVAAEPRSCKSQLMLGTIAARKSGGVGVREAEVHFQAALAIYPEYDVALYSLGRLRLESGHVAAGASCYQT
jgi:hypothetical protein